MTSAGEFLKGIGPLSGTALGAVALLTVGASPALAGKSAAPADHAIKEKGTGVSGRSAGADHAISTKGTGVSGRSASAVTFTVYGTYSDGTSRLLKVKVDSNADGGITRRGQIWVTCAGGQIVSAVFTAQGAGSDMTSGRWKAPELNAASDTRVYKGSWDLGLQNGRRVAADGPASIPVVLDSSANSLCRQ